jgi:hypothetical protein
MTVGQHRASDASFEFLQRRLSGIGHDAGILVHWGLTQHGGISVSSVWRKHTGGGFGIALQPIGTRLPNRMEWLGGLRTAEKRERCASKTAVQM